MDFLKKLIADLTTKYGMTNIAGSITAILSALIFGLDRWLGCNIGEILSNANASISPTCQIPAWFPAAWIPAVTFTAAIVLIASKIFRPGTLIRNFFGGTAVIVPKAVADKMDTAKNIVTPAQVAAPASSAK